ncbi:deoxyribonuclease-2, partial [Trichonephila inaurata madagascariensis]
MYEPGGQAKSFYQYVFRQSSAQDKFIVYKIPAIEKEKKGTHLRSGLSYAYITSKDPEKWVLSSKSVESKNSILGINLEQSKKKSKKDSSLSRLFYSDDPPLQYHKRLKKNIGHLKGRYLLYCHPNIYQYELTNGVKELLDKTAQSLFTDKPHFIKKPPYVEEFKFHSLAGEEFVGYAKDEMEESDLYSNILSKYLNEDLIVQSWRRGSGGALSPSCDSRNTVSDVLTINMAFPKRKKDILFTFTKDHSKWAISEDAHSSVVCVSDLNRM